MVLWLNDRWCRDETESLLWVHTWLSCSARAGIAVNSRDPLRDYTDMLYFGTLSQSDHGIISQYVTISDPNLSSLSCQIPSHGLASTISLGVTCFSTLKDPHSNLGTRFFLRGEDCDIPGVNFTLRREVYPNLGCLVKISISRSHLSPFIKLLMNVSPSLELFDLKNNQIWSLIKLFVSRSKHKFKSQSRLATPVQTHLFILSMVVMLSNRCPNPLFQ
jgi:hypothetical protein